MGVLETDQASAWEVCVVAANGCFDVVQQQRAIGLVGHRVRNDPTQGRHTALLVEKRMALIADDGLVSTPTVGQQRRQVAHRAAGDKDSGILAHLLRGEHLEPVHRRVFAIDIVPDICVGHRLAHLRGRFGYRVTP